LFRKTALGLAALAIPGLALIAALGPFVFVLVFGPRWRTAGEFVRIMAAPVALRLIASPVSAMYLIVGHQREDLLIHLGLAAAIVVSGIAAHFFGVGAHGLVVLTSAATSVFYGLILIRSWGFARGAAVVSDSRSAPPLG
jgi:O-antigen/teichoic acid export membrane protein